MAANQLEAGSEDDWGGNPANGSSIAALPRRGVELNNQEKVKVQEQELIERMKFPRVDGLARAFGHLVIQECEQAQQEILRLIQQGRWEEAARRNQMWKYRIIEILEEMNANANQHAEQLTQRIIDMANAMPSATLVWPMKEKS